MFSSGEAAIMQSQAQVYGLPSKTREAVFLSILSSELIFHSLSLVPSQLISRSICTHFSFHLNLSVVPFEPTCGFI